MHKQTVYIPTSDSNTSLQVGSIDKNDYYKAFTKERDVHEKEGYFFTEEELTNLITKFLDDSVVPDGNPLSIKDKLPSWINKTLL